MALISVTRLRLRSIWFLPQFFWLTWWSFRQAQQAEGNLRTQVAQDAKLAFWTITAWRDLEAMRNFMSSGAHRQAMPKLVNWCDEAALVHWQQDTDQLPSLAVAYQRLSTEGRPSKLRYPSPAHLTHQLAAPRS
jgi:hypothetical protein